MKLFGFDLTMLNNKIFRFKLSNNPKNDKNQPNIKFF